MKIIELHIIQTLPANCVNRDDLNSPKRMNFGGIERTMVSSQAWKRATREYQRQKMPECINGIRTTKAYSLFVKEFIKNDYDEEIAKTKAFEVYSTLFPNKSLTMENVEANDVIQFISPKEIEVITKIAIEISAETGGKIKNLKSALTKAAKQAVGNSADISIYGRMMASTPELDVEAAIYATPAFTTHGANINFDFYTAMEELQNENNNGAGNMGHVEFSAGTFYRYSGLSVDQLEENLKTLEGLTNEELQNRKTKIIKGWVEATIRSMPNARQHSFTAAGIPALIIGTYRDAATPIQYAEAFEKPAKPEHNKTEGYTEASAKKLIDYHNFIQEYVEKADKQAIFINQELKQNETFADIPTTSITNFIQELV